MKILDEMVGACGDGICRCWLVNVGGVVILLKLSKFCYLNFGCFDKVGRALQDLGPW